MKTPTFGIFVSNDTIKFVANKSELKLLRKFIDKAIKEAMEGGMGCIISHVKPSKDSPYKIKFENYMHEMEKKCRFLF